MELDARWVRAWILGASEALVAQGDRLNSLDRAVGDGDHGENLERGFRAVRQRIDGLVDDATPSDVLRATASALIGAVGGASGPLYGTAFARAAGALEGTDRIGTRELAAALTAAAEGIAERGRASVGEATMLDAWSPAADVAANAADLESRSVVELLNAAADAAERGAQQTDDMIAKQGRASYLGERSLGHRDPGAASSDLIIRAAAEAAQQ